GLRDCGFSLVLLGVPRRPRGPRRVLPGRRCAPFRHAGYGRLVSASSRGRHGGADCRGNDGAGRDRTREFALAPRHVDRTGNTVRAGHRHLHTCRRVPAMARLLTLVSPSECRGRRLPGLRVGVWAIAVLVAGAIDDRAGGGAPWNRGAVIDRDGPHGGARPAEPRVARLPGSARRSRITRGLSRPFTIKIDFQTATPLESYRVAR